MAPLLNPVELDDSCDDVFCMLPLKLELTASCWGPGKSELSKPIVQFIEKVEVINTTPEFYSDTDIETKWFCAEDLMNIKQLAKDYSCELRKTTLGQHTSLCVAHRKTSLMLKSDFKSLVKLSPSTPDQDLTEWSIHDDGRRGLERFASRDYAALRRKDICDTRTTVIQEYERQRSFYVKDPEIIAEFAREASRRSRTFARFFAAADASAAKMSVEPIRRLPSRCHSDVRNMTRRAPPRKRSKQYHREEFFRASSY